QRRTLPQDPPRQALSGRQPQCATFDPMNIIAPPILALSIMLAPAAQALAQETADAPSHSHGHESGSPPPAPSVAVPIDADSRAALPRETVEASAHGHSLHCEGVSLSALLQASGAMPE